MLGQFSANASALGYFYQARFALLLLLGADVDAEMSLERYDDIAFEREGTPKELLQTKHHINYTGSLTDASTDLWKTLRVWSVAIKEGGIEPSETILTLVTSGRAPEGSAASKLRPQNSQQRRDVDSALEALRKIPSSSKSETNKAGYDAFTALMPEQQQALINSIYILDSSPNIIDAKDEILERLKFSTRPQFLNLVYERVEGWWFDRVVRHLSKNSADPILYRELLAQINDIQEEYFEDNLPIEFLRAIGPDESGLSEEQRIFIQQLRLVTVGEPRIRRAINDYYRAFEQRSKWVREDLLDVGELELYEERLIDEWGRLHEAMKEDLPEGATEEQMQREGRALFNLFDSHKEIHIRPRCTEPYVMRGSYHILANKLRVGWHAEFLARLSALLAAH
jgi:hypothetical protein